MITTIAVAGTWAGATSWLELRGNFDAIALAFLLLAMLTRRGGLVALFVAAAVFTDEGALLVLPIVMVHHARRAATGATDRPNNVSWRSLVDPRVLSVVATAVVSLAVRAYLADRWGLEPLSNTRPGNHPFFDHLPQYPVGIWTALEGGWLVVAAGVAIMWRRRDLLALAPFAGSIAVTLFLGLSVFDITRRVAFVLPALPVAAVWLADVEPGWARKCLGWAATISLLWPLNYAAGPRFVTWYYPFPLPLFDLFLG